jgi:hypothetical protein
MEEHWKAVPRCAGYEVSSAGRVLSRKYGRERILRQASDKDGYLVVTVWEDHKKARKRVHALVLLAFVGPAPAEAQCRHLNGNNQDNRPGNLAWGTAAENAADRAAHGHTTSGTRLWSAKLTPDSAVRVRKMAKAGMTHRQIAALVGICKSQVSNVVNRVSWKTACQGGDPTGQGAGVCRHLVGAVAGWQVGRE